MAALALHWRETPPVHISVAALLGGGTSASRAKDDVGLPGDTKAHKDMTDVDVDAYVAMLKGVAGTFGDISATGRQA